MAHSFLDGLVGDREIAEYFTGEAEIGAILDFEVALAHAEAAEKVIGVGAADAIGEMARDFVPDFTLLEAGTVRDGVVIPALLEQMRAKLPAPHRPALHFGATSQDAIDTGLALRLKKVCAVLDSRIASVLDAFDRLTQRDGGIQVMAHTRMQAAIPVSAERKIASWSEPLARGRVRLREATDGITVVSFGGAAGTVDRLEEHGYAVLHGLARRLELEAPTRARHSERDGIAQFASALSILSGSLGKFGQDVALLAQSEVGEIRLSSGGGSSAMAHKVNPVGAEALVALARYNATLLSAVHQSLIHENERSGAAWTLEWMVLPQMAIATGAALRAANNLVDNVAFVRR